MLQILKDAPLVSSVMSENVELKKMLEEHEGQNNPSSSASVHAALGEHAGALKDLVRKVEESIQDRETWRQQLERAQILKLSTPE